MSIYHKAQLASILWGIVISISGTTILVECYDEVERNQILPKQCSALNMVWNVFANHVSRNLIGYALHTCRWQQFSVVTCRRGRRSEWHLHQRQLHHSKNDSRIYYLIDKTLWGKAKINLSILNLLRSVIYFWEEATVGEVDFFLMSE